MVYSQRFHFLEYVRTLCLVQVYEFFVAVRQVVKLLFDAFVVTVGESRRNVQIRLKSIENADARVYVIVGR